MSTKVCLNCLEQVVGDLKCGRCRIARYCNKECQVNHWKVHKNICEESNHEDATRKLAMKATNAALQGDHHKAKKLYTKLVDIWTRTLGENHPYTLSAMNDLASTYSNLGQHAEAEKLQKQCQGKAVSSKSSIFSLIGKNNLAVLHEKQGSYNEAEKLYKQVLEESKSTGVVKIQKTSQRAGYNDQPQLSAMSNLANIYMHQGRYNEAENMQNQCMEMQRLTLGENHPDRLNTMFHLALNYNDQGKYDEAETLFKQVLELQTESLGANHPDTLATINNLANVCKNQGKFAEAEMLCKQCLEKQKSALGMNHPDTHKTMDCLANTYSAQGKYAEAEKLFKQCLEKQRLLFGYSNPDTSRTISNLATTYRKQGKLSEVEALMRSTRL